MSALAELWHIVKKDVRQSRWLLAAYVLLAVAATVGAVSAENLAGGRLQLAAVLMIVTGPIAAASIIQADSPIRADAFWASKPFRRWAMLTAKLALVAVALLLLPLLGQWLGLMAFDVPRVEQWTILLASTVTYGFVLLVAMFLGALTGELRSFVLAVVGSLIALLAAAMALSGGPGAAWGDSAIREVVFVIGLIGVAALLVLLYLRRGLRWARTGGVAALALLVAGTVTGSGSGPSRSGAAAATRAPAGSPDITVEMRDTALIRREGRFRLRISLVGASGNQRYRLDSARARFFLRNGTTSEMPLWVFGPTVLRTGTTDLPGFQVVHEGWERFSGPTSERDPVVFGDVRRALVGGIDSMQVTGRLTQLRPRVFATLPLRKGAAVLQQGQRVSIDELELDGPDAILSLGTKAVGSASSAQDWTADEVGAKVYLVNEQRHEAVALQRKNSSYNPGLLVLPGAGVRQGTVNFQLPSDPDPAMPSLDGAWIRDARLVLIDWQDGPSVPVRAASVPLPSVAADTTRSRAVGRGGSPMRARITASGARPT